MITSLYSNHWQIVCNSYEVMIQHMPLCIDPAGLHPHRSEIVPGVAFASSCGGRCPNLGREAYPMCLRNCEQSGCCFWDHTHFRDKRTLIFSYVPRAVPNDVQTWHFNINSMCRKNKFPTGSDRQHKNQHHLFCSGHAKLLRQFLRWYGCGCKTLVPCKHAISTMKSLTSTKPFGDIPIYISHFHTRPSMKFNKSSWKSAIR